MFKLLSLDKQLENNMELTEEQQVRNAASNTVIELIQCGINRGAYSSVEVQAIRNALTILTTAPKVEEPTPTSQD